MGFLLFNIAYVLFFPLTIINYWYVDNKKGYFRDSGLRLDKYANREFRTLWNKKLRVYGGYAFGAENETISSALGKNELLGALTKTGKILVFILSKKHCINAINENLIKSQNESTE